MCLWQCRRGCSAPLSSRPVQLRAEADGHVSIPFVELQLADGEMVVFEEIGCVPSRHPVTPPQRDFLKNPHCHYPLDC